MVGCLLSAHVQPGRGQCTKGESQKGQGHNLPRTNANGSLLFFPPGPSLQRRPLTMRTMFTAVWKNWRSKSPCESDLEALGPSWLLHQPCPRPGEGFGPRCPSVCKVVAFSHRDQPLSWKASLGRRGSPQRSLGVCVVSPGPPDSPGQHRAGQRGCHGPSIPRSAWLSFGGWKSCWASGTEQGACLAVDASGLGGGACLVSSWGCF